MSDKIEFLSRDYSPAAYDIRDLGLLDDGRLCHGVAINDHGHVAGEADTTLGIRAVVWRTGELEDLGTLGGTYSSATAINNDGFMVGASEKLPGGQRYSFLYTDKMINLTELGIVGPGAKGINDTGEICGIMPFGADRPAGAFVWKFGQVIDIAGPYVHGSCAEAINAHGQVAGHLSSLKQYDQAFIWSDGKLYDLGLGQGCAINVHGSVAGITYQGSGSERACFWQDLHRRELPFLAGCVASRARGINNAGEIVGDMDSTSGGLMPFLWKREYTMDLNDLIPPALGWRLQSAKAINESGQITGWGFLGHRHHGFIMTPTDRATKPAKRVPPPKMGAEEIEVPDVAAEREESGLTFQDMILAMVQNEK